VDHKKEPQKTTTIPATESWDNNDRSTVAIIICGTIGGIGIAGTISFAAVRSWRDHEMKKLKTDDERRRDDDDIGDDEENATMPQSAAANNDNNNEEADRNTNEARTTKWVTTTGPAVVELCFSDESAAMMPPLSNYISYCNCYPPVVESATPPSSSLQWGPPLHPHAADELRFSV
jgi:hypothetical protein